ncbi:aminotransferase class I/II-fold pyridoxal phosphate-dependent enzyme [Helicobacter bizzozeronii]|uniref:aminotransferase class I/II-fold pyridoxal phosphate-dependent enzyme n=2 Tax=Helicobacter bizzozeronii TaxID=56877 RepID=UPI000CF07D45|nr:pyridoxal phosphate-dependent aminotransferase family protein [Helicobacter bizzozeronii]
MDYLHALRALERACLHRKRCLYPKNLIDFASNDYLGLGTQKGLLEQAFELVKNQPCHAPKASMLINGYHPLHQQLEQELCQLLDYPACVIVGSGFLGNVALLDALVRKNDLLLMDANYHASGQFVAKKLPNTLFFAHNNPQDLEQKLKTHRPKGRVLIAIEGVYSMDGQIAPKEIYTLATEHNAYLILDEAHSLGVIGDHLLGYLDYHQLKPTPQTILLGTFSKAYGSYGAFIAGSVEIIDFLCNRAKSIIYTTSLSLLDSALALVNICHVYGSPKRYSDCLKAMRACVQSIGQTPSCILTLPFGNIGDLMHAHTRLLESGFLCAAIRPPTTQKPLLRISLNIQPQDTLAKLEHLCHSLLNLV